MNEHCGGNAMIIKAAAATVALTLLAGCASDIQKLKNTEPSGGTAFSQALTQQYKVYVSELTAEDDWHHAYYFAHKGLDAAHGASVAPEEVARWDVPDSSKEELAAARQSLVAALSGGAMQSKPEEAAKAQVRFDCWVVKADEGNMVHSQGFELDDGQYDQSTPDPYASFACKSAFQTALAALRP